MQLGGMALRDGVLLQSEEYWAAAVRREGGAVEVSSGRRVLLPARDSLKRVPVIRGLVRLAEVLAVLPAVRRATGGRVLPQEDPRMLAATAATAMATLALRSSKRGSPLFKEVAAAGIGLAPLLLVLRDSRLARYHGAEHKSVAGYESGVEPASAGKEHNRCGSNLVAPLLVTGMVTNVGLRLMGAQRRPFATAIAGLISIGSAMELFAWMARHEDHPLARALRLPGLEMQRLFTTSEPTTEQLDVANMALQELLRLEGETATA